MDILQVSDGDTVEGCKFYDGENGQPGVAAFWNNLQCPLTNWSAHPFKTNINEHEEVVFATLEHFMMACKAKILSRGEVLNAKKNKAHYDDILKSPCPRAS